MPSVSTVWRPASCGLTAVLRLRRTRRRLRATKRFSASFGKSTCVPRDPRARLRTALRNCSALPLVALVSIPIPWQFAEETAPLYSFLPLHFLPRPKLLALPGAEAPFFPPLARYRRRKGRARPRPLLRDRRVQPRLMLLLLCALLVDTVGLPARSPPKQDLYKTQLCLFHMQGRCSKVVALLGLWAAGALACRILPLRSHAAACANFAPCEGRAELSVED